MEALTNVYCGSCTEPTRSEASVGTLEALEEFYNILEGLGINTEYSKLQDTYNTITNYYVNQLKTLLDTNATTDFFERVKTAFSPQLMSDYARFIHTISQYNKDEARKIVTCGTRNRHYVCRDCEVSYPLPMRCGSKFCVFCQKLKGYKNYTALRTYLREYTHHGFLRFITLTWKNVPELTPELKQKYGNDWKKFKSAMKRYGLVFVRGIRVYEFKKTETGWNVHLHVLVYARYETPQKAIYKQYSRYFSKDGYINVGFLRKVWHNVTKDSYIADIRAVKSQDTGLKYVTKYVGKLDGLFYLRDVEEIRQYDLFSRNLRIFQRFGLCFRQKDFLSVPVCPLCNSTMRISYESEERVLKPMFIPALLRNPEKYYKQKGVTEWFRK